MYKSILLPHTVPASISVPISLVVKVAHPNWVTSLDFFMYSWFHRNIGEGSWTHCPKFKIHLISTNLNLWIQDYIEKYVYEWICVFRPMCSRMNYVYLYLCSYASSSTVTLALHSFSHFSCLLIFCCFDFCTIPKYN